MKRILGSRTVFCIDAQGNQHPIQIIIYVEGIESIDVGDGEHTVNHTGGCTIEGGPFERQMRLTGQDELQLIYRCIWLSDLWLQTNAKAYGVSLFTIVPDQPVQKPFDVYA